MRIYHGNARVLDPQEITEALRDELNDALVLRQDAVERAADAETRASLEATARADAEAELARLRVLLESMKGE